MTKSVSSIFNYLLKDPIVDYLKLYGKSRGFFTDEHYNKSLKNYSFSNLIIQLGNQWEEKVINHIKTKIDVVEIQKSDNAFEQTLDLINKNTPIIYQGFLRDENFHGYIDLLVHIDYATKIFEGFTRDMYNFFQRKEMKYLPIDIKLSYNEDKNKYYQNYIDTQIYLYGKMLYTQLGKETNLIMGFIISKQPLKDKIKISCLKLTDNLLIEAKKASDWLDRLKTEGNEWNVFETKIPELYPNLKNQYDSNWKNVKKIIAKEKKEITLLYYCGQDIREKCFSKGIYSYDDTNFKNILNTHFKKECQTLSTINDMLNMKENEIEKKQCNTKGKLIFIDIETVHNHFKLVKDEYNELKNDLIIQIGVGYENSNRKWIYKSFDSYDTNLDNKNEDKIVDEFKKFIEFLEEEYEHITFVCYTKAENKLFDKLNFKNFTIIDLHEDTKKMRFPSLFSFSLKSIIKVFKEKNMCEVSYEDCYIKDGLTAMTLVLKKDKEGLTIEDKTELRKYNEIDCKALHELFKIIYN
jgi:hypothetical protein